MLSNQVQLSHNIPASQEKIINILTKSQSKIYDYFVGVSKYCEKIYATREYIADKVGCDPRTVSRATDVLHELGLIKKRRRRKRIRSKCTYEVIKFIKTVKKQGRKYIDLGLKFSIGILRSIPCFKKNVPQVNSSLSSIYITNPVYPVPCKRNVSFSKQEDRERGKNNTGRKEDMVKKDENVVTTEMINNIDEVLGLTLHGKIKLRAFEDEALDQAMSQLLFAGDITNGFEFVIARAIEYSQKRRMGPHWRRYYSLRDAYQIPAGDRNFTTRVYGSSKGEKVAYKTKSRDSGIQNKHYETTEYKRAAEMSNRKTAEFEESKRIADAKREIYERELEEQERRRKPIEVTIVDNLTDTPFLDDTEQWEELPF